MRGELLERHVGVLDDIGVGLVGLFDNVSVLGIIGVVGVLSLLREYVEHLIVMFPSLYHCPGSCKGVSEKPGTCQAKTCELFGKPLVAYVAQTTFQDAALIILRLITAAIFLYAGYAKLGMWSAPPEGMSTGMLTLLKFLSIVEPLGGAAVLVGFLTRWASAGLGIIMVGAIVVLQFSMGIGFSTPQGAGWDFPLAILGGCLILMAFGPGSWSMEAKWGKA